MNNYVQFQAEGIKSVKEKQRLLLEMMIMEANSKLERERQNWSATSSVGWYSLEKWDPRRSNDPIQEHPQYEMAYPVGARVEAHVNQDNLGDKEW